MNAMNVPYVWPMILATLLLADCQQKDAVANNNTLDTPSFLGAQLATVIERLDKAESRLSTVESKIAGLELRPFETAEFDPTAKASYARIDTNVGTFLISVQNVDPYLDGVKVTLEIGNIQSITYNGFTLTVKYGLRFPLYPDVKNKSAEEVQKDNTSYLEALAAHNKSIKEVTAKMTDNLLPGEWNRVVVTLPNIKPTEFGDLTISLVGDVVSLRKR